MGNPTWKIERNSPSRWWNKNRKKYNIGLLVSGFIAFLLYLCVIEFLIARKDFNWNGEITLFNLLFQFFGFIILIGFANIFYFLGPLLEKSLNPTDKDKYRKITFNLGFWFSCFLPFVIPIILILNYLFSRQ